MGLLFFDIKIFGFPFAVMLKDEVFDYSREFCLVGPPDAVGDVADDDAGALGRSEDIVGVDAVLVLGEERRILYLSYVMIEGA